MKKIFFLTVLLSSCAILPVYASSPAGENIKLSSIEVVREGGDITISFELEVAKKTVPCGYSALLIPVITNGEYEWALQPVIAGSRHARIAEERHVMASGPVETDNTAIYIPIGKVMHYSVSIPYQEWMNGASLEIASYRAGCGAFDEMDKIAIPEAVKPVTR